MEKPDTELLETDPRFPSGKWTGFWIQGSLRGLMEMELTFAKGVLKGEGRDRVGRFSFRGRYRVADGRCHWNKHYYHKHDVFYQGYNEGKGIWGVWEISVFSGLFKDRGGFHIWPEGLAVGEAETLSAEAEFEEVLEGTLEPSEPIIVKGM
jgi:hypothetical protein